MYEILRFRLDDATTVDALNSPTRSNKRASVSCSGSLVRLTRVAIALLVATQLACVGIGGETIRLDHDPLRTGASFKSSGFVSLVQPAEDARSDRSRVGRATITLFAITSGDIQTYAPVGEEVARNVADALRSAGYQVVMGDRAELLGDKSDSTPSPAVVVKVDEFYFRNYNWLWPFVPTWGGIQLTIEVQTPENQTIYQETIRGSGSSYRLTGNSAFSKAARNAMTEVLQQLVVAISSQEFQTAAVRSEEDERARTEIVKETAPPSSPTDRLLELKELREDELITEEQYERMRQEILEEL